MNLFCPFTLFFHLFVLFELNPCGNKAKHVGCPCDTVNIIFPLNTFVWLDGCGMIWGSLMNGALGVMYHQRLAFQQGRIMLSLLSYWIFNFNQASLTKIYQQCTLFSSFEFPKIPICLPLSETALPITKIWEKEISVEHFYNFRGAKHLRKHFWPLEAEFLPLCCKKRFFSRKWSSERSRKFVGRNENKPFPPKQLGGRFLVSDFLTSPSVD